MHRYQDYEKLLSDQPPNVRKAVHMLHEENKELKQQLATLVQFYAALQECVVDMAEVMTAGASRPPHGKKPGDKNALEEAMRKARGELRSGVSVDSLPTNEDDV